MENKMNRSSHNNTKDNLKAEVKYLKIDSTSNHNDLREIKNQSDLRDVTSIGGNKDRISLSNW